MSVIATPVFAAEVNLTIKPTVCALSAEETSCEDTIQIKWTSPEDLDACLFLLTKEEPLTCWTQAREGSLNHWLKTSDSVRFSLRLQHSQAEQARAVFQVIKEQVEYRYRRRRPWQFF